VKTLGIFVGSECFSGYLWALAGAAIEEGLKLHIHFFGAGVRLVPGEEFDRLPETVQVTICRDSAAMLPSGDRFRGPWQRRLVSPKQMSRIIQACDRHLFI
jgi:hypothetical protein